MSANQDELRKWILDNMMSENLSELDLYKAEAAKWFTLTPNGTVIIKIDRSKLDMPTEMLLVFLGRTYAYAGGLTEIDEITNDELTTLVKGTEGGQRWALAKLTERGLIASAGRGSHRINSSQVARVMKAIKDKLGDAE